MPDNRLVKTNYTLSGQEVAELIEKLGRDE